MKVFFVGKEPTEVTTSDVFEFITEQRQPQRGTVVRLADGEAGLSARTIRRRVATLSGLFGYLLARGLVEKSPVPARLPTRQRGGQRQGPGGLPLLRSPRTLPRVLAPAEAAALLSVLRTARDRAMVEAMLLGGLRRCEVLGLRLADLRLADRQLFIGSGKGGHERIVPITDRLFTTVAAYLDTERPGKRLEPATNGPSEGVDTAPLLQG